MNKAFTYLACFYFTDILKGASSNAVMHNESTSYPPISASSDLSERRLELISGTPISVPSVSGDSSCSVTTEMSITSNPNAMVAKLSSSQQESHEGSSGVTEVATFSPDLVKKYEKLFENGYNIYTGEKYVQWLRMFHPDHLPPG